MSDQDDGDYDGVAAMADRLGLKGARRSKYIHEHMTGLGYRMQPTYVPGSDDDDDDDDDDGLMPSARRKRHQGRSRDDDDDRRSRQRRSRGSDDWYS